MQGPEYRRRAMRGASASGWLVRVARPRTAGRDDRRAPTWRASAIEQGPGEKAAGRRGHETGEAGGHHRGDHHPGTRRYEDAGGRSGRGRVGTGGDARPGAIGDRDQARRVGRGGRAERTEVRMSRRMGRINRLEEQLRAAMPPPPPPPEPDPLERMAWRVFDRARQGRLRATGATGALDWRRECARTGVPSSHQREAAHKWDA